MLLKQNFSYDYAVDFLVITMLCLQHLEILITLSINFYQKNLNNMFATFGKKSFSYIVSFILI